MFDNNSKDLSYSFWKNLLIKILSKILPVANPDFDKKIDDVKYWMIEFDETGLAEREIGLDRNSKVILKMPFKNNYGYWTDNNLQFDDFIKTFVCEKIEKKVFEHKWQELDS